MLNRAPGQRVLIDYDSRANQARTHSQPRQYLHRIASTEPRRSGIVIGDSIGLVQPGSPRGWPDSAMASAAKPFPPPAINGGAGFSEGGTP